MFPDIALNPDLESNLKSAGYSEATEVQQQAVPLLLEGQDLLVSAPTGSGKTAAYLIPMIQSLVGESSPKKQPRALVLVPVRELAEQIAQQFEKLADEIDTGRAPHDQQQALTLEFYEKRISALEERLESLRDQLASLKAGNGGNTP